VDARALPGVNGPENPRQSGRATWSSRYTVAVLTAVLGTLATLGAFLLVSWWEYRVAEIDFESKAKTALQTLNSDLGDAQTLLYTLAAFMGARAQPVTAREYAIFSSSLHRRVAGVRDTGFAPRITFAQRAAFEREVRAAGTPAFQVRQFGPHRELLAAGARPFYYPLLFIEAGGTKRALLGFDLISEPVRAAAAARALRTGRAAATPPMDVATVEDRGAGILGYVPVTHVVSVGGRREISPRGLVLGVFDIPVMVRNILAAENALAGTCKPGPPSSISRSRRS
jgi:CHASE1-domain containing sensor protein